MPATAPKRSATVTREPQSAAAPAVPGLPAVPDYTDFPVLKAWKHKVLTAHKMHQQMKKLEAQYDKLKSEIGVELTLLGLKSCRFGPAQVTVAEGTSAARLNSARLLEAGVSMDVLKACTDPGKAYTSVTIRDAKKEK